jgi:hypothetical protein
MRTIARYAVCRMLDPEPHSNSQRTKQKKYTKSWQKHYQSLTQLHASYQRISQRLSIINAANLLGLTKHRMPATPVRVQITAHSSHGMGMQRRSSHAWPRAEGGKKALDWKNSHKLKSEMFEKYCKKSVVFAVVCVGLITLLGKFMNFLSWTFVVAVDAPQSGLRSNTQME